MGAIWNPMNETGESLLCQTACNSPVSQQKCYRQTYTAAETTQDLAAKLHFTDK